MRMGGRGRCELKLQIKTECMNVIISRQSAEMSARRIQKGLMWKQPKKYIFKESKDQYCTNMEFQGR